MYFPFFIFHFVQLIQVYHGSAVTHLDAALKDVSRERETFLPVDWLTEDDQLLEKEDPSFFGSGQEAAVLLGNSEGVLLEQFALGCFTLVCKEKSFSELYVSTVPSSSRQQCFVCPHARSLMHR